MISWCQNFSEIYMEALEQIVVVVVVVVGDEEWIGSYCFGC